MFLTRRKTLKALYLGQPSSDAVLAHSMLYMRAHKQPKDLADNCFQRCQDLTVGGNF